MDPLLTPEHVALILGVPVVMVEQFTDTGRLSFYQIGSLEDGYQRFSEEHVREFLRDCEQRRRAESPEPQADQGVPERPKPKHLDLGDE